MNKKTKYFLILLTVSAMFLAGCSEDTTAPSESSFMTLRTYLIQNDLDLPDILTDWIIPASSVAGDESTYYIMDIRAESVYNEGHILGAVRSTLGNIVTDAASSGGKTILVVCYTGQSAAHAVVALRLSGYTDAKVLKFGMSSWHSNFDSWTSNTASIAVGHSNWSTEATATLAEHECPALITTATDGAGILTERVTAMLTGGFKGIHPDTVLTTPAEYFINNYWAEVDVTTYGHIDGAYRILPLSLENNEIKYYDPDETAVTYCWTGQTSSMITAYLTVLGYDAKSLKFGTNGLIYSELADNKWTGSGDYTYESTLPLVAAK